MPECSEDIFRDILIKKVIILELNIISEIIY